MISSIAIYASLEVISKALQLVEKGAGRVGCRLEGISYLLRQFRERIQ